MLCLAILLFIPVFQLDTYLTKPDSKSYSLQLIERLGPSTPGGRAMFDSMVEMQRQLLESPLIHLYASDGTNKPLEWLDESVNLDSFRSDEHEVVSLASPGYIAVYDLRPHVKLQATLSIFTTLAVSVIFIAASVSFALISKELVINPIEIMIEKVKNITKDPLKAA